MVTIKELDAAKKTLDEAFERYDKIGDKTTAEVFYNLQKQYMYIFKKYWNQI